MNKDKVVEEDTCECLLHNADLIDKQGVYQDGHQITKNQAIAVYFSSNWCEPCHTFTKLFLQAHKGMEHKRQEVKVIFAPVEENEDQASFNFSTMPSDWFMLPFNSKQVKILQNKFGVRTVPKLIVCKDSGAVVSTRGRSEIESKGSSAMFSWVESVKSRPKKQEVINVDTSGTENDVAQNVIKI